MTFCHQTKSAFRFPHAIRNRPSSICLWSYTSMIFRRVVSVQMTLLWYEQLCRDFVYRNVYSMTILYADSRMAARLRTAYHVTRCEPSWLQLEVGGWRFGVEVPFFVQRTKLLNVEPTERCDRLWASIPTRYVGLTKPTRSTQPCIPSGSLDRVPALIGWGKGGHVTSAGWQLTLCIYVFVGFIL